jgi:cbb3-type cytochrome oxidase cytochrome c subunit
MNVHGCDCTITIKTAFREIGVPYSEETLREAVSLLIEEASIEGDGSHRALRKRGGVTGCVVTPLTIG